MKGSHKHLSIKQNWKKKGISNAHRSTRTPRRRATPRRSGRAISAVAGCSSSKSHSPRRLSRRFCRPKSRKTCRRFYYICAIFASTASYRCSRPPFEYSLMYSMFLCIRYLILFYYCVFDETTFFAFSPKKSVTGGLLLLLLCLLRLLLLLSKVSSFRVFF